MVAVEMKSTLFFYYPLPLPLPPPPPPPPGLWLSIAFFPID
jgi:hypothetical protein